MAEVWLKVVTTFYRRMVVVTKDAGAKAARVVPAIDVEIRTITPADLVAYQAFKPFQPLSEVETRMATGHLCFAAFVESRIIHAGWAVEKRAHIPYIHSDIVLPPRAFYIYDSYTDPAFRRSGLVMARSAEMHAHFGARGFEKSYGVIAFMNRAGNAVVEPSGYRRIGMYGCVRLGTLHHTWAYSDAIEPLPRLEPHRPG